MGRRRSQEREGPKSAESPDAGTNGRFKRSSPRRIAGGRGARWLGRSLVNWLSGSVVERLGLWESKPTCQTFLSASINATVSQVARAFRRGKTRCKSDCQASPMPAQQPLRKTRFAVGQFSAGAFGWRLMIVKPREIRCETHRDVSGAGNLNHRCDTRLKKPKLFKTLRKASRDACPSMIASSDLMWSGKL